MKILKVFGLIIFIISFMISLIMINGLIHGMEPVDWEKPISIGAFILTICLGYLFRKTLLKILLIPFQVFKRDMNKNQKIVLAIFVPIVILFITLGIANSVGYTVRTRTVSVPKSYLVSKYSEKTYISKTYTYHERNPFDWGRTWYIWVLSLTFCCIFEYKLFEDKKEKDKKDL